MTENKFEMNPNDPMQDSSVALIRVDRMYESLRYNDYSAQNGLGEIVDNSVEGRSCTHRRNGNSRKSPQARKKEGY